MDGIENDASNNSFAAYVFVAAVTFLPSHYLETTGGYTYRHTDSWEGFMKYAVVMGPGAMKYIPCFIKIGLGIQKLLGGGGIHGHTDSIGDLISLLSFFFSK
jgi:hypothetical protein